MGSYNYSFLYCAHTEQWANNICAQSTEYLPNRPPARSSWSNTRIKYLISFYQSFEIWNLCTSDNGHNNRFMYSRSSLHTISTTNIEHLVAMFNALIQKFCTFIYKMYRMYAIQLYISSTATNSWHINLHRFHALQIRARVRVYVCVCWRSIDLSNDVCYCKQLKSNLLNVFVVTKLN